MSQPSCNIDRARLFTCVALETINHCNRSCHFCKFGQPKQVERVRLMPMDLIVRILLNLQDLQFTGRVSLFKINEPLMDKRIFDLVRLTKSILPNCYCTVLSNGDLISAEVCERFLRSGLDSLSVSVYDDATLVKITEINRKLGNPIFVTDRRASDELFDNRGGNVVLTRLQPRDTMHRDCQRPSTMLNVNVDGTVVLCCVDFYGAAVMGNLQTERAEDIWFGPRFEHYRTELRANGRAALPLCNTCDHTGAGHDKFFPKH